MAEEASAPSGPQTRVAPALSPPPTGDSQPGGKRPTHTAPPPKPSASSTAAPSTAPVRHTFNRGPVLGKKKIQRTTEVDESMPEDDPQTNSVKQFFDRMAGRDVGQVGRRGAVKDVAQLGGVAKSGGKSAVGIGGELLEEGAAGEKGSKTTKYEEEPDTTTLILKGASIAAIRQARAGQLEEKTVPRKKAGWTVSRAGDTMAGMNERVLQQQLDAEAGRRRDSDVANTITARVSLPSSGEPADPVWDSHRTVIRRSHSHPPFALKLNANMCCRVAGSGCMASAISNKQLVLVFIFVHVVQTELFKRCSSSIILVLFVPNRRILLSPTIIPRTRISAGPRRPTGPIPSGT